MADNDRRRLLQTAALTSAAALAAATLPGTAAADEGDQGEDYELTDDQCKWTDAERLDYRNIRIAGLDHDEAICWLLVARATLAFFNLPKLHPSEVPEVVTLVHGLQTKLLSRPTYRDYMDAYGNDADASAMAPPPQAQ